MLTIHKHRLELAQQQTIHVPADALFLDCQMQRGQITTWWMLHDDEGRLPRTLLIYGTGANIDHPFDALMYMATVQVDEYVWHLFELWEDL